MVIAMKQQAALEFMVTYAWAIVVISLFIVFVFIEANAGKPTSYVPSTCNIQPLLPCEDSLIVYNSLYPKYYIVFTNGLGSVMNFPLNAINISYTSTGILSSNTLKTYRNLGACSPSVAYPGASVLCNVSIKGLYKLKVGSSDTVDFILNYSICSTSNVLSCTPGYYKSSGYSTQGVVGQGIRLEYLTFNTGSKGTIVLNGVIYLSGTSTYLQSGNYVIYAQPSPGKSFSLWTVNSPSVVASSTTQNTILTLDSNADLNAQFT